LELLIKTNSGPSRPTNIAATVSSII
jgi:hypothetical protein